MLSRQGATTQWQEGCSHEFHLEAEHQNPRKVNYKTCRKHLHHGDHIWVPNWVKVSKFMVNIPFFCVENTNLPSPIWSLVVSARGRRVNGRYGSNSSPFQLFTFKIAVSCRYSSQKVPKRSWLILKDRPHNLEGWSHLKSNENRYLQKYSRKPYFGIHLAIISNQSPHFGQVSWWIYSVNISFLAD